MNNRLSSQIERKIIKKNRIQQFNTLRATVTSYDNFRNRADIIFDSPNSSGKMVLEKVPVAIHGRGFKPLPLKKGDFVWVTFINNSPHLPKIISLADEDYEIGTRTEYNHLRSSSVNVLDYEETLTSVEGGALSLLLDENNDDITKHFEFMTHDINDEMINEYLDVGNYDDGSIGITNPATSTTIKSNKNGDIEINIPGGIGIFISNTNKNIYLRTSREINLKSTDLTVEANSINIKTKSFKVNGVDLCEVDYVKGLEGR